MAAPTFAELQATFREFWPAVTLRAIDVERQSLRRARPFRLIRIFDPLQRPETEQVQRPCTVGGLRFEPRRSPVRVETFPCEHLEASRRNDRLQAEHVTDVEAAMAEQRRVCAECGSSDLAWFYFSSPAWTWEHVCGRAGVIAYCDACERQVAFVGHLMN